MVNNRFLKNIAKAVGLLLSLLPQVTLAAEVTTVQLTNYVSFERIILTVTDPHNHHVFTLANPNRVIVDLQDAHLKADVNHFNLINSGIANIRKGRPVPSTLRIVFDMAEANNVKKFVLNDEKRHQEKIYIDIYPLHPRALTQAEPESPPIQIAAPTPPPPTQMPTPPPIEKTVATATPTMTTHLSTRFVKNPIVNVKIPLRTLAHAKPHVIESKESRPIVVVIDPGHGGKDPGTIAPDGTKEKDVVLAIALRLADLINSEPNMHAVLTRHGDYFVTLSDRLMQSRRSKADIFIAIHADSYMQGRFAGASVYALSRHGATNVMSQWLADQDNHSELGGVNLKGLSDKSYVLRSVLIDLAQTATITDSIKLGTYILDGLENVTTLHYPRVEQAPFMVLKSPDIPSILVETGFLSNPKEEDRLRDSIYRDKLAHALLAGIRHYMAGHPMTVDVDNNRRLA